MALNVDIEHTRGDSATLNITVTRKVNAVQSVFPITGATIWMTVKKLKTDADGDAIFVKKTGGEGIIITSGPNGTASITIDPDDTLGLTIPTGLAQRSQDDYKAELFYDIQVKTVTGDVFTTASGRLIVSFDVTVSTV